MRGLKAKIENGTVVNFAAVDTDKIPEHMVDWPDGVGLKLGMVYDDQEGFISPPKPEIPTEQIQAEANTLLEATDWIFIPDANVTPAELSTIKGFRQAVQAISHSPRPRDLGFPPLENRFKRNGR